jgi:toxin ParE1/3/4
MSSQSYRVEWTAVARRDLTEIVAYLEAESPQAALQALESIEQAAASLESMPDRGRLIPEVQRFAVRHYRELIIQPHRLVYRVRGEVVYMLGVFDGRRNLEDVLLGRLLSF